MSIRPVLLVGDLHLGPAAPEGTGRELSLLLGTHPGHELVLLGDVFDLSIESDPMLTPEHVRGHLRRESRLAAALRDHVLGGGSLTLIPGNHDAWLGVPGVRDALVDALRLPRDCPIQIGTWWIERFGLHLEHGHVWDPDNAPTHPLVVPTAITEPIGTALTRRVLAPSGALCFAHAHETTPLQGLASAFQALSWRAPHLVSRYFATALMLVLRAAPRSFEAELHQANLQLAGFCESTGRARSEIEALLSARPTPRHHQAKTTARRLYLDRALATLVLLTGLPTAFTAGPLLGLLMASLGGAYLSASVVRRKNRYRGLMAHELRAAGRLVRTLVNARAVVFGHTHVAEETDGYINLGSFGFPGERGRPFVLLSGPDQAQRGYVVATGRTELRRLALPAPTNGEPSPLAN